jgi:hypothetical protein
MTENTMDDIELARLQACEECLRKLVIALDRMTLNDRPAVLSMSVSANRNEARRLLTRKDPP